MNKYDSAVMASVLEADGYELSGSAEEAGVILLNTCSVRQHAEDRAGTLISQLKTLKKKNPAVILGVCGCMAQKEGQGLFESFPHIDVVCGTGHFHRINALLERARGGEKVTELSMGDGGRTGAFAKVKEGQITAWLSIMRGCERFCSYCVVPFLRGKVRSRPFRDIISEVKNLEGCGVKEVTLLGQNVLSFSDGGHNLTDLLEFLDKNTDLERIRFLTSHPADVTEDLFLAMKDLPSLCPHLHLPLQSGSDKVLGLMGRGYTMDAYCNLVREVRHLIPEVSITTDIIVGFPGEDDEDFAKTKEAVEEIMFDDAYIYRYSVRPGTRALTLPGHIEASVAQERLETLITLQRKISAQINSRLEGQSLEVLVEGVSRKEPDKVYGRTDTNKMVVFKGDKNLAGKVVDVYVEKTTSATLTGR